MTNRIGTWLSSRVLTTPVHGAKMPIVHYPARSAVWAMILADVSGSMSGTKLDEQKKAVKAYAIDACALGERVGLMSFSDTARHMVSPTSDAALVGRRAKCLEIEGNTYLTPALRATEALADGAVGVWKVVVVTDGMAADAREALTVAARMREHGFFFVTVGIPTADEDFLKKLRGPEGRGSQTDVGGLVKVMQDAARLLPAR